MSRKPQTVKRNWLWYGIIRVLSCFKPTWVHDHWNTIWHTELTLTDSEELRKDLAIRLNRVQTEVQQRANTP